MTRRRERLEAVHASLGVLKNIEQCVAKSGSSEHSLSFDYGRLQNSGHVDVVVPIIPLINLHRSTQDCAKFGLLPPLVSLLVR